MGLTYPIDSSFVDSGGRVVIRSDAVLFLRAFDLEGTRFWSPDGAYSGFAADGYLYADGIRTVERATWANESMGEHRGSKREFPCRFFVAVTADGLSIINADDFTLWMRATYAPQIVGTIPGVFLEWVPDDDTATYGTILGIEPHQATDAIFLGGKLFVTSSNGVRVFDFHRDEGYVLHNAGHNLARLVYQKGLAYRNKPDYFSPTIHASLLGVSDSSCLSGFVSGGTVYCAFGSTYHDPPVGSFTGESAKVLVWSGQGTLSASAVCWSVFFAATVGGITGPIVGTAESLSFDSAGNLFCCFDGTVAGCRYLLRAERGSWVAGFLLDAGPQVPVQDGIFPGTVAVSGDDVYLGIGFSVYRTSASEFVGLELRYGCTSSALFPIKSTYDILFKSGLTINSIAVDPVTKFLGVLHGDHLDVVNPCKHSVSVFWDTTTSPKLPAGCTSVWGFSFSLVDCFGVSGLGGLTLLLTVPEAHLEYDPVYRGYGELDGRIFYEVLPDVYSLLADYDLMPQVWSALAQIASDLMLQALCASSAQRLLDVPVDFQRKYSHLDFWFAKDLSGPCGPNFLGRGEDLFVHSYAKELYSCVARTGLSTSAVYWPLRSLFDETATVRWSWTSTFSSISSGSYALFGYLNSGASGLRNSLLVGVGNGGRVCVLHVNAEGGANFIETAEVIPLGEGVTFEVSYSGPSNVVTISARDSSGAGLLVGFTYNLGVGPAAADFVVNSFGAVNLDISAIRLSGLCLLVPVKGHSVVFELTEMGYIDPSLQGIVQALPRLQDRWTDPALIWTDGVEYELHNKLYTEEDPEAYAFISAREQVPEFLLAEYISYDQQLLRRNFGLQVGLDGPNTANYRSQVQALHGAFWTGPTLRGLRLGVQVLLRLPFVEEDGVVIDVDGEFTSTHGRIVVFGDELAKFYLYPRSVSPVISVGDEVSRFDVLTDGVEVLDWKNSPDWFVPFLDDTHVPAVDVFSGALGLDDQPPVPLREIQKYHMFMVRVNSDLFSYEDLVPLRSFIASIKQVWKAAVLAVVRNLLDEIPVGDELSLEAVKGIWDHGGSSSLPVPTYGGGFHYGDGSFYGMYHLVFPAEEISLTLTNMDPVNTRNVTINGIIVGVPPLGSVVEVF